MKKVLRSLTGWAIVAFAALLAGCGKRGGDEAKDAQKAGGPHFELVFLGPKTCRADAGVNLEFALCKRGKGPVFVDVTGLGHPLRGDYFVSWSFVPMRGRKVDNGLLTGGGKAVSYSGMRLFALMTDGYSEYHLSHKCGPFKVPGTLTVRTGVTVRHCVRAGFNELREQRLVKKVSVRIVAASDGKKPQSRPVEEASAGVN